MNRFYAIPAYGNGFRFGGFRSDGPKSSKFHVFLPLVKNNIGIFHDSPMIRPKRVLDEQLDSHP